MRSFRSKPVGWRYESAKHALAAKGISSRKFAGKEESRAVLDLYMLPPAQFERTDEAKPASSGWFFASKGVKFYKPEEVPGQYGRASLAEWTLLRPLSSGGTSVKSRSVAQKELAAVSDVAARSGSDYDLRMAEDAKRAVRLSEEKDPVAFERSEKAALLGGAKKRVYSASKLSSSGKKIISDLEGQEISWEDYGYVSVTGSGDLIKNGKVVGRVDSDEKAKRLLNHAFEDEFGFKPDSVAAKKMFEEEFGAPGSAKQKKYLDELRDY